MQKQIVGTGSKWVSGQKHKCMHVESRYSDSRGCSAITQQDGEEGLEWRSILGPEEKGRGRDSSFCTKELQK